MKKSISSVLILCISILSSAQDFVKKDLGELTSSPSASRSANFLDVNDDGWDDVFISNGKSGGENNELYINNQNGTFTAISGDDIVEDGGSSDGASFADMDNDGDMDMFVVTWYGQINSFYKNDGDGAFTYLPNSAMGNTGSYSEACAFGDANGNGCLDLVATNSGNSILSNRRNLYYENNCDGTYTRVQNVHPTTDLHISRSADWIDIDEDGDLDLFITNESDSKNDLFINDGNGTFTKNTTVAFVLDERTSAGSSWSDIDNDGDFDLFIANWDGTTGNNTNNQLFINHGSLSFTEVISGDLVSDGGCSFASTFADYDNDGDEDLFVANAYCSPNNNFFYENVNGIFVRNNTSILATETGYTFGAAWGDYNNDGFMDMIWANTLNESQPNDFFENEGNGNNWFKILLEGTTTNRSAIGTVVKVKANINGNDVWQMRRINSASGYCSQNSYTQHFGLGDATIVDSLVIEWFSGHEEIYTDLEINKACKAIEGTDLYCSQTVGLNELESPSRIIQIARLSEKKFKINAVNPLLKIESVEIFRIDGSIIKNYSAIEQKSMEMDLSNFPNGVLFVRIHAGDRTDVEKIVNY